MAGQGTVDIWQADPTQQPASQPTNRQAGAAAGLWMLQVYLSVECSYFSVLYTLVLAIQMGCLPGLAPPPWAPIMSPITVIT